MFQKVRDTYKMQKQAKAVKKDLQNIHIESEHEGITIKINAEMEILEIQISDEAMERTKENKKMLENALLKAFEKAVKKAQQIAAEKMRSVMGDFGME